MRDLVTTQTGTFFIGVPKASLPAWTSTFNSPGVDLANYNGATMYILAGTWTDGTHTITLQESSDNSSFADVAAADLVSWQATSTTSATPLKATDASSLPTGNIQPTAITSAATMINWRVGYIGAKRYIRAKATLSGITSGATYDIVIQAGHARVLPPNV